MKDTRDVKWKPIPGYEGFYSVSDDGRVYSESRIDSANHKRGGHFMSPLEDRDYYFLYLRKNGSRKRFSIHILVALAFIGKRPEGLDVCHNNGNGKDNRLSNLRYDTKSENCKDTIKHGRNVNANKESCPRGHPLLPGNLKIDQLKNGWRTCLACNRTASYLYAHPDIDFEALANLCFDTGESPGRLVKMGYILGEL